MRGPIDTKRYPHQVVIVDPLPVTAHIWLKNNQIDHQDTFAEGVEFGYPEPLVRCICFANADDAAWFALKWS
jgi:hypothetical protein